MSDFCFILTKIFFLRFCIRKITVFDGVATFIVQQFSSKTQSIICISLILSLCIYFYKILVFRLNQVLVILLQLQSLSIPVSGNKWRFRWRNSKTQIGLQHNSAREFCAQSITPPNSSCCPPNPKR